MGVAEEVIHKTAFRCHAGQYEFTKVPFGLEKCLIFLDMVCVCGCICVRV